MTGDKDLGNTGDQIEVSDKKASKAGSEQAQKDMPEHIAQKQKEGADFKKAGLGDKLRTFVSETLGRMQLEDDGEVLVKGVAPGAKRDDGVAGGKGEIDGVGGNVADGKRDAGARTDRETVDVASKSCEVADGKPDTGEKDIPGSSYVEGLKSVSPDGVVRFTKDYIERKARAVLSGGQKIAMSMMTFGEASAPQEDSEQVRDLKDLQGEISIPSDAAGTHEAFRTVTVKDGDTLWAIAGAQLDDGADRQKIANLVDQISRINSLADPDKIFAGQELIVPPWQYPGAERRQGAGR
ncbi:MAG: LysM peptidoglycan-binding domain-containing protein [Candidatus Obscuribacterales bacterium]|nr:LysM peptidoglycan-binding domain-containing protein [Candidatus Obscuribacterales bacterium]